MIIHRNDHIANIDLLNEVSVKKFEQVACTNKCMSYEYVIIQQGIVINIHIQAAYVFNNTF